MSAAVAPPPAKTQEKPNQTTGESIGDLCFIETQFPVSKMSKESYVERKGHQGQSLTGLGKWWGRKPLVLCRAAILGLLLPATDNPQKDREVFLRLMTMDDDGMLRRKSVSIAATELFNRLPPADRARYFEPGSTEKKALFVRGLSSEEKDDLQRRVFFSLSYDERLNYCDGPEQINGPSPESWTVINAHLGTGAKSLPELVAELGQRRFGHVPRLGDSFCGGGSIPFEAARIGCNAYGSDLNPVAAMLTWAAINIIGGGDQLAEEVHISQRNVYEAAERQIAEWGIEHREQEPATGRRWRADAYLYCTEVRCPECNWRVPLAPTWVIGKGSCTVAKLVPDTKSRTFDFEIRTGVSAAQLVAAAEAGTIKNSELVCPNSNCGARTPIKSIRGDGRGTFGESKSFLRGWENDEVIPRSEDVFTERMYCIRWIDTWIGVDGKSESERHYATPTASDFARDQKVLELLRERFDEWQKKGFIPCRRIEPGLKTDEPIRTRGWTHWHHLFTPRQLLQHGLLAEATARLCSKQHEMVINTLALGRCANWNSRLCQWGTGQARESIAQTFYNQAFNTFYNFAGKSLRLLEGAWFVEFSPETLPGRSIVKVVDGRVVDQDADIWVTDPPYGDAINYHELSEFFLAWGGPYISAFFGTPADSRRALAVRGESESFRESMTQCYRRLTSKMPDNGLQLVMFTHQNTEVWADLALILWAAGLRVCAAWCVATETDAGGIKEGNYVQGTVLLVLRKQMGGETAFLDEVYQDVEVEVRRQLDTMRDLDDSKDPNFSDTDYQLAAYAAALRVLTAKKIEEIDVAYELTKTRTRGEKSPVEALIERAVTIACDHLVPKGIDTHLWKALSAMERLYLKGLELESHGEHRTGVYQELARGFGVDEYRPLLGSTKANETRLKTATEFNRREMGESGFGASIVRNALFAVFKTAETESTADGITWLKTEVKNYAAQRQGVIEILEFLAALRQNASLAHWHKDAEAAGLLAGALRNRQDNV